MQRMQRYSYSSPTICYSDSDTLIFEWRQPGLGVTQDTKDSDSFPQLVLTQRMTVCVWSELPHRLLAIASSSKLNALQITHDHNPSHKWFSHFLIDEGTLYFNPDLSDNTSPFPSMSHSCQSVLNRLSNTTVPNHYLDRFYKFQRLDLTMQDLQFELIFR